MNKFLDDKSRFVKVLELLPESFIDDFVRNHLWNASYPRIFNDTFIKYDNYSKELLSEFSNLKINKNWKAFNKSFYTLRKFLVDNFWSPKHLQDYCYLRPDIHHNFSEQNEASSNLWGKYKNELDKIADEFEKAYKEFIKIAKKEIEREEKPKKRLWKKTWVRVVGLVGAFASIIGLIFYIFSK